MSDILIAAENALQNSSIPFTYSSERKGLPFVNIYDPDCTKPWQTTGDSSEYIIGDYNGYEKPSHIFVCKSNASATYSAKIEENDTNTWGSPFQSVSFDPRIYAAGGGTSILQAANSRVFIGEFTTAPSKRYQRYLFQDASNPDGFLRHGYIHVASVFSMKNVDYGWTEEFEDDSIIIRADQGSISTRPRKIRRVIKGHISRADLDTLSAIRKLTHLGAGFCTFLGMNPYYIDSTFDHTSSDEWLFGYFRRVSDIQEDFHHGYNYRTAREYARVSFDFEFAEIL